MFPCVGLKQKVFAWGGTVISAVLLHIYSCTFSVGHLMLLNDVKLWLMQADARLSAVNEKLLCDDEQRRIGTVYTTVRCYSKHTCKDEDIEWLKPSVSYSFPFISMSLIYCGYGVVLYQVSPNFPAGAQTHASNTHIGVVNKICFALVPSDRGYL